MLRFDEQRADCRVYTEKEGLLSSVAHDLELAVTRFEVLLLDGPDGAHASADEIAEHGGRLEARFDPTSLRVVTALRDGQPHGGLRDFEKRTIERNIVGEVLEAVRHPELRYVAASLAGALQRGRLDGELTLHGRTRAQAVVLATDGDRLVATAELHQPDYGIRPYSAMLGTLRVQPGLRVRLSLPLR